MTKGRTPPPARRADISAAFIAEIVSRLRANKPVRRMLPGWGRLHVDRQLPFLCLYRRRDSGDEGTARLVTTEAAYLIAPADRKLASGLTALVTAVAQTLAGTFGAVLILEVWAAEREPQAEVDASPSFRIIEPRSNGGPPFADALQSRLSRVEVRRVRANVTIERRGRWSPPGLRPILPQSVVKHLNCTVLGLEVAPIFRAHDDGQSYPLILRALRRGLSRAYRQAFYEFAQTRTSHRGPSFHVLGRRAVVKAVWDVDRQLSEISDEFDFLLQVTPLNAGEAWATFRHQRGDRAPRFRYRPLRVDPALLKRSLHNIPLERIEDPALGLLFRQKLDELDRQMTMLTDLNTSRFVHGSIQLYGGAARLLLATAIGILEQLGPRSRDSVGSGYVDADGFAARAVEEIRWYRERWKEVDASVQIRDDIGSGLMVSSGNLLIGRDTKIPGGRVNALLQHEVGTHIVTYYNGRAQPFRQLYTGLAGYEALQEGLAVLAEYLVGGLSRPRLRLLAARVVATASMIDGATFVDSYRRLRRDHGFEQRTAFMVTMRVYRGGGLTKDAIYLRGLQDVLSYLGRGGKLEPLYVGKIAAEHIPIVQELRWRSVLRDPPLTPRFLHDPDVIDRLSFLEKGRSALDLVRKKESR